MQRKNFKTLMQARLHEVCSYVSLVQSINVELLQEEDKGHGDHNLGPVTSLLLTDALLLTQTAIADLTPWQLMLERWKAEAKKEPYEPKKLLKDLIGKLEVWLKSAAVVEDLLTPEQPLAEIGPIPESFLKNLKHYIDPGYRVELYINKTYEDQYFMSWYKALTPAQRKAFVPRLAQEILPTFWIPGRVASTDREKTQQLLQTPLDALKLSTRARKLLKAAEIKTFGELVTSEAADMMTFRNFGKKSLTELENLVAGYKRDLGVDLYLGMDVSQYLDPWASLELLTPRNKPIWYFLRNLLKHDQTWHKVRDFLLKTTGELTTGLNRDALTHIYNANIRTYAQLASKTEDQFKDIFGPDQHLMAEVRELFTFYGLKPGADLSQYELDK